MLGSILAVGVLSLSACGGSSSSSETGGIDLDATLRTTYAGVQTLDPAKNTGSTAMMSNTWPVYDRLLQISEDGEYLPMLATEWTFSPDGKALTLKLREGVTFSDGTPFDAETVKVNVERYKKEPMSADASAIIDNVEVVDDHTVKLHLTEASQQVLTAISSAAPGIMISPKALASEDLGTKAVGTGAWVVDSFRPGQQVTYKRRTDEGGIWDPDTGKVARIEIESRTTDAAYAAVRSGQIDIALSNGNLAPLQPQIDSGQLIVRALKSATTTAAVYMNQTVKPFDDVRVRQAVNYAIDRDAIVKALVPTTSARVQPMASSVNGFDESLEKTYPYDPAKAKQLLAEAGHADGLEAGTFYVANYAAFPDAAQVVQASLAEVGIKIDLELYDIRQLVTQYSKSKKPGSFHFLSFPGIEPGADLAFFLDNPLTLPGGVPDKIAQLIERIDDPTVSADERASRAAEVIRYATEQAYFAPLWQGVPGWVQSNKVHGVEEGKAFLGVLGGQDLRHAWISK
ncbi:ABC transporter substrate-binding protein [Sphaerimonospora cavernae]|uniref:ABC transporter substrate-binding protein n=1 Tax=Sphaerimonospora cavernae TaxID=1740611 RepID=A0ABV6U405_9ACTN